VAGGGDGLQQNVQFLLGQIGMQRARAPDFGGAWARSNRAPARRIRARVEHSIGVIKRVFGLTKVRYRGLAKNGNRVFVTAALANIFLVRYTLLGAVRPL